MFSNKIYSFGFFVGFRMRERKKEIERDVIVPYDVMCKKAPKVLGSRTVDPATAKTAPSTAAARTHCELTKDGFNMSPVKLSLTVVAAVAAAVAPLVVAAATVGPADSDIASIFSHALAEVGVEVVTTGALEELLSLPLLGCGEAAVSGAVDCKQ